MCWRMSVPFVVLKIDSKQSNELISIPIFCFLVIVLSLSWLEKSKIEGEWMMKSRVFGFCKCWTNLEF